MLIHLRDSFIKENNFFFLSIFNNFFFILILNHLQFVLIMSKRKKFVTITGVLMRVSDVHPYRNPSKQGVIDYFHLGVKTADGKRIKVSINTHMMGWSGAFDKSKIWYWNKKTNREIKTSFAKPSNYIGTTMKITGFLEILSLEDKKYKMTNLQKLVLFP